MLERLVRLAQSDTAELTNRTANRVSTPTGFRLYYNPPRFTLEHHIEGGVPMAKKKKAAKKAAKKPAARVRAPQPTVATASQVVKRAAASQRIVISLTNEQFQDLAKYFTPAGGGTFDPRKPFQIDFETAGVGRSRLPVASCAFWSDTCCV